jgi:hypothetical protein
LLQDGGHPEYPDTIISADSFSRVRISGRQVLAEGYGTILTNRLDEIKAWDGAGTNQPDQVFSIKATAEDGHVFEMSFTLKWAISYSQPLSDSSTNAREARSPSGPRAVGLPFLTCVGPGVRSANWSRP